MENTCFFLTMLLTGIGEATDWAKPIKAATIACASLELVLCAKCAMELYQESKKNAETAEAAEQ